MKVHPKPEAEITAEADTLFLGESTVLNWTSQNGDTVEIDQGIGVVDPSGSIEISPSEDATYTITVTGPGGIADDSVTVYLSDADLEPTDMDLSGVTVDGQSLVVTGTAVIEISNHGNTTPVPAYQVTLFEDTNLDEAFTPGADQVLGLGTVPGGPAGGQAVGVSIPLSGRMNFKGNRIFALADSGGAVRETVEENNITNSMARCVFHPPVGQFDPVVEWSWTSSDVNAASINVMCTPAVANLNDNNGDGLVDVKDIPDIVFNSFISTAYSANGTLRAVSGDGSGELFSVAINETLPGTNPAVGDIDGDGLPEVLTFHEDGRVMAFENDGTLKWTSIDPAAVNNHLMSVTLADVDGDGAPEILVGGHVFKNDGTTRWIGSGNLGAGTACVANLDLAGHPEVIVGGVAYRADGSLYWGFNIFPYDFCAVADLDDDPYPEVVYTGAGYIFVIEHDGSEKWRLVPPGMNGGGPPVVADFDGDGAPEIGVAGQHLYVVVERDGVLKWSSPIEDNSGITGSSVFDFEGDGSAEVVYADEGAFRIYRGSDGEVLFQRGMGSGTLVEFPVVADVDNDNNAEIVVVANFLSPQPGLYVFGDQNDTWVNTRNIWNQHAYHITNVNDDASIPAVEADNWETFNSYRQNDMLNPLGCVDLTASYIRVDQSNYPDSVDIPARAGNGGVWHVSAGTKISFYHGHPDTGGTLIGTAETGRLDPGAWQDLTITWTDPPDGLQDIYARIDDDGAGQGQVLESDEDNNLAHATFTIGNTKPVANAGEDQTVHWGQIVQLDGSGSTDADSDLLSHLWTITTKPTESATELSDFTAESPTFEADAPGTYTIELTVHDGTEYSDPDTITVTAQALTVPDVTGLSQSEAETQIAAALLQTGAVSQEHSLTAPQDQVMSQSPAPGTEIPITTPVDLIVSLGLPRTTVPTVTRLSQTAAETAVLDANLTLGSVTTAYSETIPDDLVAAQSPSPGASVPIYTPVDISISLGPEPITVPNVIGLERHTAETGIITAKLAIGTITEVYNDTTPEGQVIDQSPTAGDTVTTGTPVNLTVSLGSEPVVVPDVVGLDRSNAEAAVTNAGLSIGGVTEEQHNTVPENHVISQDPVAGSSVPPGSAVDLTVSLGADVIPPQVTVSVDLPRVPLGDYVIITVTATDNLGVETQTLKINDAEVTLTGNQASYTPSSVGIYTAEFTASDEAGNSASATVNFTAYDPNDLDPPVISIESPEPGNRITAPTDFTGVVSDDNLEYWVLEYTRAGTDDWKTIASGDTTVSGGVFGSFDPTTLANGAYEVRLYAVDLAGQSTSVSLTAPVTGFLKPGINKLAFTDLQVPVSGIDITVVRSYDSFDKRKKDFGYCWSVAVHDVNLDENRMLGEYWYEDEIGSFVPEWVIEPYKPHFVVVTYPDGKTDVFELEAEYVDPVTKGGWEVRLKFTPKYGTTSSLEILDHSLFFFNAGTIIDEYGDALDPTRYLLTTKEGQKLTIHQETGLEKMEDLHGNSITIDDSGITHSSGKSISFARDGKGRIIKIMDPMGYELIYSYDDNGDLSSFTNQEEYTVTFTYDDQHNLIDYTDPRGIQALSCEYDESGRLIATYDAEGNRSEIINNLEQFTSVVTNRRGYQTTYVYDENGYVLSETDHYGNVTSFTYDENGNKTSDTNALGYTWIYTYDDMGNQLTKTDPLGNTTEYEYNSRGQVTNIHDALNRHTAHFYNSQGKLIRTVDPAGYETISEYSLQGGLVSSTDALGHTTTYEHDVYGNTIKETDPLGNEITYTYDTNGNRLTQTKTRTTPSGPVTMTWTTEYNGDGNVIRTIDPYGSETIFEYNEIGKKSAKVNKNGNRTEYEYNAHGYLVTTIYSDGLVETTEYDEEGLRRSSTDRGGRITQFEYDALGRLVRKIYPDGGTKKTIYNAAGHIEALIDENGNRTDYQYDEAGRRTKTIDVLGNETIFAYDGVGNMVAMTDANNHIVTYEYDELNRCYRTIFHDGTNQEVLYDAIGSKVGEIDQNGIRTDFEYDEKDHLTRVIDAMGGETSYTYDELGNKLTQTDPNGHTASWEYDHLGRVIKHTLPLGMYSTYTYDAVGNRLTRTDFNGDTTTYTYDVNSRVIGRYYPDGSEVTYTYTPSGKIETVTDSRGLTSRTYDQRDRIISEEKPAGKALNYTYDLQGNRTSVTTPSGTTNYTFDALNRLETVTDPSGGVTSYTYNAVGSRTSVKYPNGTYTEYTYDDLNRLILLTNRKVTGEPISSYTYTLDAVGNRMRVVEHTGRIVNYTYDNLHRLVEEDIVDSENGNQSISYTYDNFGNRLTKTDYSGQTTYTYDKNDRLLIESGPEATSSYQYDANGNTISKISGSDQVDYFYDFENRLIDVQTDADTIHYTYDYDGIKSSKSVDGYETHFLVDKNRAYAQVLEETDPSQGMIVRYTYGDDLISQDRNGSKSYYHYDGQMSTRQLTNTTNVITGTYTYDAFGMLLKKTGSTENDYYYTGEQYDLHLGLYYLRARYYAPENGRFYTSDSFGGNTYKTITLNKYIYGNVNPVKYIDPSGNFSIASVGITISIIGILAAIATPSFAAGNDKIDWLKFDYYSLKWFYGPYNKESQYQLMVTATTAVSGFVDKNPYDTESKNTGPIPEGDYEVELHDGGIAKDNDGDYLLDTGFGIQEIKDPGFTPIWGRYRARIHKTKSNKTTRTGFYLHSSEKGYTHGCIETLGDEFIFMRLKIYHKASRKMNIKLRVDYSFFRTSN